MLKRLTYLLAFILLSGQFLDAQITTSNVTGYVKEDNGAPLVGATVVVTHVPTGTVYKTQTKTNGKYDLANLNPGGPYTFEVSFINFQTNKRDDVYLTLGETAKQDFALSNKVAELTTVVVAATRAGQAKGGVETNIGRDRVANLPSVGRNISDLLRTVPQAKLSTTEGAISIAGQNNRYNAFYIDGALNNDVFGLAGSGTNGGQANIPPISLDAIDQIQVSISPYDASLSGFTGGGINAITRSGTNTLQGSVYYLFRNQKLAGKTPTGLKAAATKLPDFQDKTYGFRVGGPIIKNKLFYFLNGEIVRFERPQVFDVSRYSGTTSLAGINALADTLRTKYGYEPGGFQNNPEKVRANRIIAKIDWNLNANNKLSFTYRYNDGERFNVTSSSTSTINFYNNGYLFPTTTHSFAAELRSTLKRGASNRLLVTYADVKDDRQPIGDPFPRVRITDGSGALVFGPDNSSTINLLTQKNLNLLDVFRFTVGKHTLSVGTDDEWNNDYNAFIQNTFGNYTYSTLADFYTNARPNAYSVGYSLIDNKQDETTAAAAKFKTMRLAAFVNDEVRPTENLTLNFALRADYFQFVTKPATDSFTNNVAIPKFAQYYDLEGARSGQRPNIPVSVSPRIGVTFRIPDEKITLRGGVGLFTGRIPLVWPAGIYNNNGINQGGFTANAAALNTIRFRSDPFKQWRASDVGISLSKGPLNLISKKFKLPKVFRISAAIDKQLGNGWTTSLEGFYTKNVNELYYTNINILPPTGISKGPGPRTVYALPDVVPITSTGTNPYDNAILLSNAKGKKGFSYNLTFSIDKRFQNGFSFNTSYSYGESMVVHEPTSSVNLSQWRFVETANGRNFITRSYSDFSPGHRILAYASKKFNYLNNKLATTVTLLYTGQSGAPFSYVYSQVSATVQTSGANNGANPGPVRDDPNAGGNDLFYIPTAAELQTMSFVNNTVNGVTYTPQQQRDAMELFIQNNKYLRTHRGSFAERNGDRLPFTHLLDLKIAQDFNIKIGSKRFQFQLTYDVFNFTNMLNRNWGRTYFLLNDNFAPALFFGYVNSQTDLTPQYRFNPTLAQPQSEANISTSSAPSYSPRWTSQLGIRVNF
jgi:outer membrane receptor for ferrienterochelin and colicin